MKLNEGEKKGGGKKDGGETVFCTINLLTEWNLIIKSFLWYKLLHWYFSVGSIYSILNNFMNNKYQWLTSPKIFNEHLYCANVWGAMWASRKIEFWPQEMTE